MKVIREIIKLFINAFAVLIKQNQYTLKYLFTKALKSETIDFIENQYYRNYAHIDKSIEILKIFDIDNSIIVDVGGADGTTAEIFAKNFSKKKFMYLSQSEKVSIKSRIKKINILT